MEAKKNLQPKGKKEEEEEAMKEAGVLGMTGHTREASVWKAE